MPVYMSSGCTNDELETGTFKWGDIFKLVTSALGMRVQLRALLV
jgi:hypothetical protein